MFLSEDFARVASLRNRVLRAGRYDAVWLRW